MCLHSFLRSLFFSFSFLFPLPLLLLAVSLLTFPSVNATEDGIQALLTLAKGDMRKILNVLQATSMAYDVVNEENVYLCTGNPLPADIRKIVNWLLNEDFTSAFESTPSPSLVFLLLTILYPLSPFPPVPHFLQELQN